MSNIFGLNERELQCGPTVPTKYWTDTGGVDEQNNPILINEWITMVGSKPSDGDPYTAQPDGTWLNTKALDIYKSEKVQEVLDYNEEMDTKPFEYPIDGGIFWKTTNAVGNTLTACSSLVSTDLIPTTDGKWDNVDFTHSQVFTVGEFQAFYDYGYSIPKRNYDTMKSHVGNIMGLDNIDDVVNYPYKEGWI